VTELTAIRTVALREAVGRSPEVALLAALHALCLRVFYHYTQDSCVELELKSADFGSVPGLADHPLASAIDERHRAFADRLPRDPVELWDTLADLDAHIRAELFAHCVSLGVNGVYDSYNRRPRALAHADRLAQAVNLDMAANWTPTGRVTKARIVDAVREVRGDASADRIAHLKKAEMAERAEALLAGTGWLPEPLRTPGQAMGAVEQDDIGHTEAEVPSPADDTGFGSEQAEALAQTDADEPVEQSAANDGEQAMVEDEPSAEDADVVFEPLAIAAE